MNKVIKFEDLSNEILLEILEHLHAIDIFVAFGFLNRRISSILRLVYLRIIITSEHHHWHIEQLSNHLIIHADQVISLSIDDDTEDRSSAIDFLFKRHRFDNIHSCLLKTSCSVSKLTNFNKQLKDLVNLQSLYIIQPKLFVSHLMNKYDSSYSVLSRMRSTALRSVALLYHYHHCGILNDNKHVTSKLTYLELILHISSDNGSINSLIDILRFCPLLRRLRLVVRNEMLVKRHNVM